MSDDMKKRTLKSIFLKNNVDIEIPENIYFEYWARCRLSSQLSS